METVIVVNRIATVVGVLTIGAMVAGTVAWAEPEQPPGITGAAPAEDADGSSESPGAEPEASPSPPPGAVTAAPPASQQERLKTIVNLSFTNAELKNVLNSLAKVYGLNLVAGETVTGTVTVTLRGVTLEEGLRQMLKLNGFGFTVSGEIIEISKLTAKRANELVYLKYLNADTALEFVKPMASEGGVLKVDETANAILVSDFLDKIHDMRDALAMLDKPPQQVLIESKLMDITHTDLDNLGLKFSSYAATVPYSRGSLPLVFSSGSLDLSGPSSTLTSDTLAFTVARGDDTVTVALDALIQQQRVKVIASPTVLTVNNVEAKITIGEKFPIREQTQTSTGTLETTRFVDVGTTLRVTPRINRDGFVQLHIHPEVSSVSSTIDAGPRITTREADTTVIVRDGQPIVIGGLIKEDETAIKGRVPLLGHVPLLGLLFQNRSKDHTQKELVIIITPHFITVGPEPPVSKAALQEVAERFGVSDWFARAIALENQTSLEARQSPSDLIRYQQAVAAYQQVVDGFPMHPYAMESLWRIGEVSWGMLRDTTRAREAYQRLITQFPGGRYRRRAEEALRMLAQRPSPRRPRPGAARQATVLRETFRFP